MLGTAYRSSPAAIITMIELTSEIIRNMKVRLMLAVSFPRSVVPLSITHPPTPPLFHATDRQRGSHSNQHVEHGRYASALHHSPTSEHTAHRHLRVALNSETHVSDDVTQRVAPGEDGEAENDGRDVEHEPDGVEQRDELVGDGGDPEHGENEAGENEDLRWREGGDRTTR